MRFRAMVELSGKTATGICVPEEVVAGLGSGRRPAVRVEIGGYSYRTTVASMGGRFMLPVSAEHRERAGVAAGDDVDVDIALDTEAREVVVPDDLATALRADSDAQQRFTQLSYSNELRHVLAVEGAKTSETRQRRVAKVVAALQ